MNESASSALFIGLLAWVVLALPAVIVWGWVRWKRTPASRTVFSKLSFSGFLLANLSVLLAVSWIAFAHSATGSPVFNSLLLKLYSAGLLLAAIGMVLALCGVWRASALRWPGVVCSAGILGFWLFSTI